MAAEVTSILNLTFDLWLNPQWTLWFFLSFPRKGYSVGYTPWKCGREGWKGNNIKRTAEHYGMFKHFIMKHVSIHKSKQYNISLCSYHLVLTTINIFQSYFIFLSFIDWSILKQIPESWHFICNFFRNVFLTEDIFFGVIIMPLLQLTTSTIIRFIKV